MSSFADWQKSLSDSIMALLIGPAVKWKWEMTKYVAVCFGFPVHAEHHIL